MHPNKKFVITRLGLVIGPGDRLTLPALVNTINLPKYIPRLVNKGKDTMPVTPPQDVARAQVFLARKVLEKPELSGEAFNVTGHSVRYKYVFEYVCDYYGIPIPTSSVPAWVFRIFGPFLWLLRLFLPKTHFLQEALSPTALKFIGKSFKYSSQKIRDLGFEYEYSAEESIQNGLKWMDPEKKMITQKFLLKLQADSVQKE